MSTTKRTVKNLDAWSNSGYHEVVCPSTVVVGIRIPDLAAIIEGGELPQHLVDAALKAAGATSAVSDAPEITVEDIKREREFTNFLVAKTVEEPALTPEDVSRIPVEDKEMIAAIALRLRDLDAEGSHISGLDKSEKFRKFRGLGEFEPTVEG
jgi:hypothetical protein